MTMQANMTKVNVFETLGEQPLPPVSQTPHVRVMVSVMENAGGTIWVVNRGSTQPVNGGQLSATAVQNTGALWADLEAILAGCVRLTNLSAGQRDSLWMQVESIGNELYDRFVPPELQKAAGTWPDGAVVVVATNEEFIPWELIHDGEDFWGSKFVLARVPMINRVDELGVRASAPTDTATQPDKKVVNVIGGGIQGEPLLSRARILFDALRGAAQVIAVERGTLADVRAQMDQAELVHFTCHGHGTPIHCLQLGDASPSAAMGLLSCLTTKNVDQLGNLAESVVFANACNSGVAALFLGELQSFGRAFYRKRAAAFIGTLGSVPIQYAIEFGEEFYEELIQGVTVGEALRRAKRRARQENPFWLLYCLYGDPFAKKVFTVH